MTRHIERTRASRKPTTEVARQRDSDGLPSVDQGAASPIITADDERWAAENRAGMDASNRYVEQYGIPFADLHVRRP